MKKLILTLIILITMTNTIIHAQSKCDSNNLNTLLENIKENEQFSANVYVHKGKSYIGYGHLLTKDELHITYMFKSKASIYLRKDLNKYLNIISKLYKHDKFTYQQQLALASFAMNIGIGKYLKSSIYEAIKKDINPTIFMKKYNKVGHKVSENLTKRREFEIKLFNNN